MLERFLSTKKTPWKMNDLQFQTKVDLQASIENGDIAICTRNVCLCGSHDRQKIASIDRFGLDFSSYICKKCGLIFTNPYICDSSLPLYYNKFYHPLHFGAAEPKEDLFSKGQGSKIFNFMKAYLNSSNIKIFEMGAGCGTNLLEFANVAKNYSINNVDCYGNEYNNDYVKYGNQKGLKLVSDSIEEYANKTKNRFDVIILSHIFEHLTDLFSTLDYLERISHEDTILYIEVPGVLDLKTRYVYDCDFLKYLTHAHIFNFSLSSLNTTLNQCGFELLQGNENIESIFKVNRHTSNSLTSEEKKNDNYKEILSYLSELEDNLAFYQSKNPANSAHNRLIGTVQRDWATTGQMDTASSLKKNTNSIEVDLSADHRRTFLPEKAIAASNALLAQYKDKHQGQRCVIIGNGPSLNRMDLSFLKEEITFGLNRIYLLFDKWDFTPTYYVSVNPLVIEQSVDDLLEIPSPKFLSLNGFSYVADPIDIIFLRSIYKWFFSTDPRNGICEGYTVTYVAMQLAYFMGFSEVMLIGVDHHFTTPGQPNQEVVSGGVDPNHFHPDYFGKGTRWNLPDLKNSEVAYNLAKAIFEANGRRIVDATLDGRLKIFPKANYQELFEKYRKIDQLQKGHLSELTFLNKQGEDLFSKGNFEGAFDAFEKALYIAPNNAVTHNNLGLLYYNQGDKEKALSHYKKAADLQPQNITFLKNLADFYYVERGWVEEAMQIYIKVLNANPEDIETLLIIGHICVALKKFDDAKDFYSRILIIEPLNKDAKQLLEELEKCQLSVAVDRLGSQDIETASKEYLVSAIVSTYSSERFIRGRLQNLIDQTLYGKNKLEIIVIDSNSPQNERQIVDEFKSKYMHIVYVRTPERETVYGAWNRGIQLSRGKYIINANTDDRFAIDALEFMANESEVNPDIDAVYGDWLITQVENDTFESETNKSIYRYPEFFPPLFFYGQITSHATFIRKDVFDRIGLYNKKLKVFGDRDLMFRFSAYGLRAKKISRVVGLYLQNPTSLERSERETGQVECSIIYDHFLMPENFSLLFGYDNIPGKDKLAQLYADIGSIGKILYSVDGKPVNNRKPSLHLLMKAFEIDNTNVMALNNLGVLLAADGKQSHAVKMFEGALQNSRGHEKLVIKKNLTIATNGSVAFADYICLMPDHLNYHISISSINREKLKEKLVEGEKSLHEGRDEEAEKIFKKELRDHPNKARVHNDLGVLYYNKGIKGKALDHYQLAAQLEPNNITFHKNLSDFYYVELGRLEEALQGYVHVLSINPKDVETLLIVGHICVALHKFDDAQVFYSKVLEFEPENMDARQNLDKLACGQLPVVSGQPEQDSVALKPVSFLMNQENAKKNPNMETQQEVASKNSHTSIIIPALNQQKLIKKCVKSIQEYTSEPHEIIFVNKGGKSGTLKWLRSVVKENENYHLVELEKDADFAIAYNKGIEASSGEYIVLLHGDVVVTEGWLSGLLECIKSVPDAGIVGPMTNNTIGVQKVADAGAASIGHLEHYDKTFREKYRYRRVPIKVVNNFCMLFRRDLVEKIGLLDESLGFGSFENEDFCLRATLEGYKNLIAADVFIYKHNGKSQSISRKAFNEKWSGISAQSSLGKNLLASKALEKAVELDEKGQIDNAVKMLLEGMGHAPKDKRLNYAIVEMLINNKQFKDAFDTLNEMPPEDQDVIKLALIGYCMEGMERYNEAEEYADRALSLDTVSALALNLKGILAFGKGDKTTAEDFFKRAIDSDPGYGEPYTNLGTMKWDKKEEEAFSLYEKGFILSPTIMDVVTIYHSAVIALGKFERAEQLFRDVNALHPHNKRLKYLFIDILVKQGKHDIAMNEVEEAIIKFGTDDGILSAAIKVRDALGPMKIENSSGNKGSVSLCMIVKNEEQHLAKCLMSVKPVVDEMTVVDTGSTDRTMDIARAFGARIYDFKWTNDFSEARNYSISKASGAWIFVLDADEVISSIDYDSLRKIVKKPRTESSAYYFVTRNYTALTNTAGWVSNDGRYTVEQAGTGWYPSKKVRLFPSDSRIRFENHVHELVEPSLRRSSIKIMECSIPVHHYGKLSIDKVVSKGQEYYILGKTKLEGKTDDVKSLTELAIQALELGKYEEALEFWQKVIEIKPDNTKALLNMGGIYLELGMYEDALRASRKAMALGSHLKEVVLNYSSSELFIGDIEKSVSSLENLVRNEPEYPPAIAMLSTAYFILGEKEKGLKYIDKIKKMGFNLSNYLYIRAKQFISAGKTNYALLLLEIAVESNNVNRDVLSLLSECIRTGGTVVGNASIQPKNPEPISSVEIRQ